MDKNGERTTIGSIASLKKKTKGLSEREKERAGKKKMEAGIEADREGGVSREKKEERQIRESERNRD